MAIASKINADVDFLNDTMTRSLDTSGTEAVDTQAEAARNAEQVHREVTDVTDLLQRNFTAAADKLRSQITETKNTLASADWEGSSRANADEAEAALHDEVNQVLDIALDGVNNLKTTLLTLCDDFQGDIDTKFRTVMTSVESAYTDLSTATRTFADNMISADQTIRVR